MSAADELQAALREKWRALAGPKEEYPFPGSTHSFPPFVVFCGTDEITLDGEFTLGQLRRLVAMWEQVLR